MRLSQARLKCTLKMFTADWLLQHNIVIFNWFVFVLTNNACSWVYCFKINDPQLRVWGEDKGIITDINQLNPGKMFWGSCLLLSDLKSNNNWVLIYYIIWHHWSSLDTRWGNCSADTDLVFPCLSGWSWAVSTHESLQLSVMYWRSGLCHHCDWCPWHPN